MSTLTHEDLQVLRTHFPASDHEFDYNKNAYIKEQSICNRIEEVDPAWSLSEPKILWRDGQAGTRICEVTVSMTIKGVSRGGVGQKEIVLTKNGNAEANQAAKSAATDALKRAARLFGIGRYLLETPNWVNNEATMAKWLNQPTEAAPSNVTEMPSKNGTQDTGVDVTQWQNQIKALVQPLYVGSDGKLNPHHMDGSIKKALEKYVIGTHQTPYVAAAHLLVHRAEADYGLDTEAVQAILGGKVSDTVQNSKDSFASAWSVIRGFVAKQAKEVS